MARWKASRKPDKPLRRARHETFVREYMTDFDGETAARRAGYSPAVAKRVWRVLLGEPMIAKRMMHIKWGGTVPNLEKGAVLRALAEEAFADTDELWATNPFSGERIPVLSRATHAQMRHVAWKTKSTSRGGVTSATEETAIIPGRAHLGIIASAIGLAARGGSFKEEDQVDDDMVERIRRSMDEDKS